MVRLYVYISHYVFLWLIQPCVGTTAWNAVYHTSRSDFSKQHLRLYRVSSCMYIQVIPVCYIHLVCVQLSLLSPCTFCTLLRLVACLFWLWLHSSLVPDLVLQSEVLQLRSWDHLISAKPSSSSRRFVEFVSAVVREAVSPYIIFVFLPHPSNPVGAK